MDTDLNSYLPRLAIGVAMLIDEWRAEISDKKDSRPKLQPAKIDAFLQRTHARGVPALQVALAILACEWAFRVRIASSDDIENVLYEMEASFCKPLSPMLTPFQAHLLINAVEPSLRRQMKNAWISIVHGFGTIDPHPRWNAFPSYAGHKPKREVPTRIVTKKRGRPPLLGPIIAGLIVEAMAEEFLRKGAGTVAKEIYALLLRREVQGWELKKWRTLLEGIPNQSGNMRVWMRDRMKQAYHQTFELPGEVISPEHFVERCKADPRSMLWWFEHGEIIKKLYSIKWG